jgi:ABC-type transporter Mla MlaB component
MTGDCALYDDGVLRVTTTDDPPGLAIAGEIDESTYPGLVSVLDKLTDSPAEIHVSLAQVSYCDLAGLRAIVRITGADGSGPGGSGAKGSGNGGSRRVVLHGVPRPLQTVLQIVGWDSIPGLAVDQPDSSIPPRSDRGSGSHGQESVIW